MSKLTAYLSVSLDGFVAGANARPGNPLGDGGERLHEWVVGLKSWREDHGMSGGEENQDSAVVAEWHAGAGACVMGRGMFDDSRSRGATSRRSVSPCSSSRTGAGRRWRRPAGLATSS